MDFANLPMGYLGTMSQKLRQVRPIRTPAKQDLPRFGGHSPTLYCLQPSRQLVFLLLICCAVLSAENIPATEPGLRIIVAISAGQAQKILERLKNGEDFAALAK